MRCHVCSHEHDGDARFCSRCGSAFGPAGHAHETRKIVTVLFCDLIGSTALTERYDPELVREVLLRYYESMRTCLTRHGGVVEKFIGDAVVGVLGVPVVNEDDALRAVRAAIDMRAAVTTLNQELRADAGVTLSIRVGVNTGEVVATGDPSADQALVAGEVVNVAARLQQHAAPGEVLIGAMTYHLVRAEAVAEPVAPLNVKGKLEPVTAWRLRDMGDPSVARTRPDAPLIGRDHDLRRLQMLLDATLRDRVCHLCTLFGEAGMGKTRLARAFLEQARAGGAHVGTGHCQPYGTDRTLAPLAEALGQLLGGDGGGRLRSLLDEPTTRSASQLLAGVVRDGSPGIATAESFWAVRQSLRALANGSPVILAVDGLQWAAPALLDLLDGLADRIRDAPVLLLCLARLDLLDHRPGWAGGKLTASSFVLQPLSPADSLQLARTLVEVTGHGDADHAARIGEASGGNPFFVEQLAAMSADGGDLGTLPPTIQALVAARLDQLGDQERAVMEWAAILGRSFSAAALADMTGTGDDGGVDAQLDALIRHRLIEVSAHSDGDPAYRFANTQIREVAYRSMPKRVRADRHERAAAWLGHSGPAADDAIGFHLEAAFRHRSELGPVDPAARELQTRAAEHLGIAGRDALTRGDLPYARSLLERALNAFGEAARPERLDAMACLADVLLAGADTAGAQQLLDELAQRAAATGNTRLAAHARLQLATLRVDADGVAQLVAAAEAALPLFEVAGDATGLARAWLRLAQASQDAGRHDEAVNRFGHALDRAREAGAELELATTLGGLTISLWQGPLHAEDAIARCRALLASYPDGHRAARAAVGCPLAVLLAMRRRVAEARATLEDAERVLHELDHTYALATVPLFGGLVETMAGRPDAAEVRFGQARNRLAHLGDQRMLRSATLELARVRLQQDRGAEAAALLDSVPKFTETSTHLATQAASTAVWARVLAARGAVGEADRRSRQAVELVRRIDSPATQGMMLLDRAHVLLAAGRQDDAQAAVRDASTRFDVKGHLAGQDWAAELLRQGDR